MTSDESSAADEVQIRREKRQELRNKKLNPYPYSFEPTHSIAEARERWEPPEEGQLGDEVTVAGRIMNHRTHGGAIFADLKDETASIQLYISADYLEEEDQFEQVDELWDAGDWAGVRGELFETNEGELSVVARELTLLSKGLRPLPEKFHGLKDPGLRARRRSMDMVSNPESRRRFETRTDFLEELRGYLSGERGYREVETPMMHPVAGGAEAKPFITHHNAQDMDLFLRIAPELYLKRLLVGGMEKIYEINRNFRNEGLSRHHNPEFTMMELYRAYADYEAIMDLTEETLSTVIRRVTGSAEVDYRGETIDWRSPWERLTLKEAVERETELDLSLEMSAEELYDAAYHQGIEVEPKEDPGAQLCEIFEQTVEDNLVQPTFIKDFPASVSPLAKPHREDDRLSERFELFAGGMELGNAYSELNDPVLQRERLEAQIEADEQLDEDFLRALEHGMPPAGGLGIGIDRLVMLITDAPSIRDVILFPLLRPESD